MPTDCAHCPRINYGPQSTREWVSSWEETPWWGKQTVVNSGHPINPWKSFWDPASTQSQHIATSQDAALTTSEYPLGTGAHSSYLGPPWCLEATASDAAPKLKTDSYWITQILQDSWTYSVWASCSSGTGQLSLVWQQVREEPLGSWGVPSNNSVKTTSLLRRVPAGTFSFLAKALPTTPLLSQTPADSKNYQPMPETSRWLRPV